MKLKSLFTAALLATAAFASSAQAAPWTFTVHGTVNWSEDYSGIFGTTNLTGLKYTQTITAETDPSVYRWKYEPEDPTSVFNENYSGVFGIVDLNTTPALFTESITINGVTLSFRLKSTVSSDQYISNAAALNDGSGNNAIYSFIEGQTEEGYTIHARNVVGSPDPAEIVIPTPTFAAQLGGTQSAGNGFYDQGLFALDDKDGNLLTQISLTQESFELNAPAADVPEPASLALLGLGLLGLGAVRRKRSHA